MPYEDEDFLQQRKRLLMLNAQDIQNQLNSSYPNGPDIQRPEQSPAIQQPQVAAPPVLQAESARPPVNFNIAPEETPAPQGPSPFQQVLHQEPMQKDFHPSTARKIGGILSGVLGGVLSGSPEYGMKVAHNVDYAPYKQQHSQWEQQLQNLYSGEQEQQGVDKNKATIENLRANSRAEEARKEAENARRQGLVYKDSDLAHQRELEKDANKASETGGTVDLVLENGDKLFAVERMPGGGYKDPRNPGTRITGGIKSATPSMEKRGNNSNLSLLKQAFQQQNGREPTPQELESMNQGLKPAPDPSIHEGHVLRNKLTEAQIDNLARTSSPERLNTLAEMVHENPDLIDRVPSKVIVDFATAYKNKYDEPIPAKLSAVLTTQRGKSRITIEHVGAIRHIVQDPRLKDYLGPIMGRYGDIAQYSGGEIRGIPPELQSEAQELRTRLKYLLVQESASLAGNRPAIQLISELKKVSPDTHMTIPFLMGALNGVEGSNKTQLQAIDHLQRGEPIGGNATPQESATTSSDMVDYNGKKIPRTVQQNGATYLFNEQDKKYHKQK